MPGDAPVLIDFESVSRADLKVVGGRNYWEHPSTQPLCCAWYDTSTGDFGQWHPGEQWPHAGRVLGAHNMTMFDRFGCESLGWIARGEHNYIDTSELARMQGLPGALDAMAQRWLGRPKDKVGSKLTKSLSTVRRPTGKNGAPAISAEEWKTLSRTEKRERGILAAAPADKLARVDDYNYNDVEVLADAWPRLEGWDEVEPDVVALDREINDRGIMFDSELASALLECDEINTDKAMREIAAQIPGWSAADVRKVAGSDDYFPQYSGLPNAQAQTVEEALEVEQPFHTALTRPLCIARQALASIERGKLRAGLARVSPDGRLRDMLRYYGAHTGRWSGVGMQLHNLPKPGKKYEDWTDDDLCRFADAVRGRKHLAAQDEITLLVRACLTAPESIAVCDFSGVEARANAWAAGDAAALEVFTSGRDPYKVAAAEIFGCRYEDIAKDWRRDIGKRAELGCGYGAGGDALWSMVKKEAGFDLDEKLAAGKAAGGSGASDADDVVAAWRKLHAPIVKFWYALNDAFVSAACGEACDAGPFQYVPDDAARGVSCILPSGRPIVYPDVQVKRVMREGKWGKYERAECSYAGTKFREHVYGGMLCENAIQAMCRDLLARAMVRASREGLPLVLSVHDEGVLEAPTRYAREVYEYWREIMLDLPEWAAGFPIGAAGFWGRRYRK